MSMELNITNFFNNGDHWLNSNSIANLGQNAGTTTWNHAKEETKDFNFIIDEETRQAVIDYFEGFGAWNDLPEWTNEDLNALLLQEISACFNEIEGLCTDDEGVIDWQEYEFLSEKGTLSGRLFKGVDDQIYYYLGL